MTTQYKADISEEDEEMTFNPPRESERDNSEDSPTEENHDGEDASPDAEKENNQDDPSKEKPFHEHPRWLEREEEWNKRFNEQEKRHGEQLAQALKAIKEEIGDARRENDQAKIPSWFGGTDEQWAEYKADRDRELKETEERAKKAVIQEYESKTSTEDKAVKEATDYLNAEIKTISSDKVLNPEGLKVDPETLVKFTIENELVDTKGRWNYRAAFKMMKSAGIIKPKTVVTQERKELGGATVDKNPKGEPAQKTTKSSLDFKKPGARPW